MTDIKGNTYQLSKLSKAGKIVVLEWISPECPISMAYHEVSDGAKSALLHKSYKDLAGKDFAWLAINSLSLDTEGNSREDNQRMIKATALPYPLLLDSDKKVAKAYGAVATPDIFIIDTDGKLAYSGAVDEGTFNDYPKGLNYILETVKALRKGQEPKTQETQPFGCSL